MKASKLMLFTKETIYRDIPENVTGVIYLRGIADEYSLYPIYYVSKAHGRTVKEQLLIIFNTKGWNDAVYMNYVECSSNDEANTLEQEELKRYAPKYNAQDEKDEEVYVSSISIHHKNIID